MCLTVTMIMYLEQSVTQAFFSTGKQKALYSAYIFFFFFLGPKLYIVLVTHSVRSNWRLGQIMTLDSSLVSQWC